MSTSSTLERQYVSTLLTLPALLTADTRLEDDDITDAEARAVYRAIVSLTTSGRRVTRAAVKVWLAQHARMEAVPDLGAIEPEIAPLVEALRRIAKCRRMTAATERVAELLRGQKLDLAKAAIGELTMELADAGKTEQTYSMPELLKHALTTVKSEAGTFGATIATGQPTLDAAYRLTPGSLLTIGASTNVGKSTTIMTWLYDMASKGIPVGLVSVEDPAEDWGVKALGAMAGVAPSSIWRGRVSAEESRALVASIDQARDYPLSFSYVADRRIDGVLGRMEYLATQHGARVIAVDYLQAISHRPGKDIRQRIDSTLEELISTAGRLGVALILASQLSRPGKGDEFREPHVIDLKESGSIENRSQCVVLLWRESSDSNAPILGKIAKAKRHPAGATFALVRGKDTGLLREQSETHAGDSIAF
jgi:replicative DNA helicase